jgi:hypothetical protein
VKDSKTFEITYLVGSLQTHYTTRVHADSGLDAGTKLGVLVPALKRVWEIGEIARPLASAGHSSVDVGEPDADVIWTGNSDVESNASRNYVGAGAQVTISPMGDVLIEMLAGSKDATFAPLNYAEEALALRACVRALAHELAEECEAARKLAVEMASEDKAAWRDVELEIFGGLRLSGQAREVTSLGLPALEVREDRTADREPITYMRAAVFSSRWLTAKESAERAADKAAGERALKLEQLIYEAVAAKPLTTDEIWRVVGPAMPGCEVLEFDEALDHAAVAHVTGDPERWEQAMPF